jgi:DNA polymerase II small subunit/DNA polymerase delta subunit B
MHEPAYRRGKYNKNHEEEDVSTKTLDNASNGALLKEVESRGYFASKIPPQKIGKVFNGEVKKPGSIYKFGIFSDPQMGSKYQQMTHLHSFYKKCEEEKVDAMLCAGDVVDGEKVYRGQEYELFIHGADAQRDYAIKNLPHIPGVKTYMISGNHDTSFWSVSGYNIVQAICDAREDLVFLGDNYAVYTIGKIKIALMHGSGGVAYARSYKLQKIIEQIAPENKPHMLFLGHYHVEDVQPMYRNVVGIQLPCFQAQTPYLARGGLYPELGGWIVEFGVNEKGFTNLKYEHVPFYVPINKDY